MLMAPTLNKSNESPFRNQSVETLVLLLFLVFGSSEVSLGNQSGITTPLEVVSSEVISLHATTIQYLETYCTDCHGADPDDVSGGVDLASVVTNQASDSLSLTEQIIEVIEANRMPPKEANQPSPDATQRTIKELDSTLELAVEALPPDPKPTIRRMNRFQYNNAVVDLFQLNCIVFTLPERIMREHGNYFNPRSKIMPDVVTVGNRPLGKSQMIEPRLAGVAAFPQDLRAEHGYDNQADHLSMSPLLLEAFLQLGTSITYSPDFNPKHVGIWNSFFVEPTKRQPLKEEMMERLRPFLRLAFRGQASEQTLTRYTDYGMNQITAGKSFTDAMREVAAAVISSPKFFYLYETNRHNSNQLNEKSTVSEKSHSNESDKHRALTIATRLSLFLWGSIPDHELLTAAESDKWSQPEVLNSQITRMLADKKLKRFCDTFPSQWLQLERLISSIPNPDRYPEFYYSKYRRSMHMMLEPLLLFETVLIENRSIRELIDPEFTYRSSLLDNSYGELKSTAETKPGPGGQVTTLNFHRVPISDRRSGGVINNAAVMTMTSGPNRTQPITRGAWIAGVIFNSPPKPPPADVPPLDEDNHTSNEQLSLREQLDLHRKRSDCKGCHEQIDPLGFALENYDAIGRWREQYDNGAPIDPSGVIGGYQAFESVVGFKDALLMRASQFTLAFTEHLAAFALARQLTVHDRYEVKRLIRELDDTNHELQTIIRALIQSSLFHNG